MDLPDSSLATWVTSIEILKITGISRATLNNYIKYSLLPNPLVKRPDDLEIRARKIGYFPRNVLERISTIKKMKGEGKTMKDIVKLLSEESDHFENKMVGSDSLNVSINDITSPAFLINNRFEIVSINMEAMAKLFYKYINIPKDSNDRSIFKLLSRLEFLNDNNKEYVKYMMMFYKKANQRGGLPNLFEGISKSEVQFLQYIYDIVEPIDIKAFHTSYVGLSNYEGKTTLYNVYHLLTHKGILFIHLPVDALLQSIMECSARHGKIITNLMRQRMPTHVSLSVLVANLQESSRISAELPSEEYIELISDIWKGMDVIFQRYYGAYGKRFGDGVVYYFLKEKDDNYIINSVSCAVELRDKMRKLSIEWKMRKGWFNDLYLNIGIDDGQAFFAAIPSSPYIEFTALGDFINYASNLSDIARYGAILTTKNFINHLDPVARRKVCFGIRRKDNEGDVFIENTFSRVMDIVRQDDPKYPKFKGIDSLAITEIVNASTDETDIQK